MNPLERFQKAATFQEPDKVPLFLLLTMQGAKELNMSAVEYFSKGENVAKGQMILQEKYKNDVLYPFFYAAKEYEAFGGESMPKMYGPPESGRPIFQSAEDLLTAELPDSNHPVFSELYKAHKILVEEKGDQIPILNDVIAPLSLPVMLLGFETWIETMVDKPEIATDVVNFLVDFTIDLSNRYLEEGASAIAFFNPVSSKNILKPEEYRKFSLEADKKFYKFVKGAAVFALAGGEITSLLPTFTKEIGIHGAVISSKDDLAAIKKQYGRNLILVGNLDNIAMTHWDIDTAEREVKRCIEAAAEGGGYILCDHHGDIPSSVPEEVIHAISTARDKWGVY